MLKGKYGNKASGVMPAPDNEAVGEQQGKGGSPGDYNVEALMREYGNDVLRTAYSYVKDVHMAEDLFQETFVKVFRYLPTFKGESSIKTWIIRIAVNTCKDYLKSAYSQKVVPMMEFAEEAITSEGDFDEVEQADTNVMIKDAVMQLPEKYREVVMLTYFNEMSLAEVSKMLNLPEGTVKSRLSRARERLKEGLKWLRDDSPRKNYDKPERRP